MSDELKFEIGNKTEQLLFSVFDITTNCKYYPVKFRNEEIGVKVMNDIINKLKSGEKLSECELREL